MANEARQTIPAPQLLTPENGARLAADAEVILSWESVEQATEYHVQLSTSPDFPEPTPKELLEPGVDPELHEIVLDTTVKEATALDVTGALPTKGIEYYWRVRARTPEAWGPFSEVWSFFIEEEPVPGPLPGEQEELGPVAELVKTATEEAKEALHSEAHTQEEVEPDHFAATEIISIVLVTLVVLVMLSIAVYQVLLIENKSALIALTEEVENPRLEKLEMEAKEKLSTYGVVDASKGIYRVPIDRAMELIVQEYQQNTDS